MALALMSRTLNGVNPLGRIASAKLVHSFAGAGATKSTKFFAPLATRRVNGSASPEGLNGTSLFRSTQSNNSDVLIIGCGVAGSAAALKCASQGLSVRMLSAATDPLDCNSYWAQGGIIYKAEDDTPDLLASDIHYAGANVCDDEAVDFLTHNGPSAVDELLIGTSHVPFDRRPDGKLALCLEASHNRARIIHWKDHTGKAITQSIQAAAAAHPNITLETGCTAVDLAQALGPYGSHCVGVHALRDGAPQTFLASATVLATGGLGDLYENTSNPASARGDGFAMALRVGAQLQSMEYVQFHPTTLYLPGERRFLLTEALRGEGARLLNTAGERFAGRYHELGELAPRDVVARMIVSEMQRLGSEHVYLDISHRDAAFLKDRFPSIYEHCLARGLDLTAGPVPIVPAAHYFCGGVAADTAGRTSVPGLFAAGETACTGLHGANRLASTSLLEGLVWGRAIGGFLGQHLRGGEMDRASPMVDPYKHYGAAEADPAEVEAVFAELRRAMWRDVGVVRSQGSLQRALAEVAELRGRAADLFHGTRLTPATVGLRNAVAVGGVIAQAALANPYSIGAHYLTDGLDAAELVAATKGEPQLLQAAN
mmetsp:Transcript_48839/g.83925  ORF Transcript_48839/g.83925 Transcript_48839/m.83925 type:complete len:599 (+) Transcript_48839:295-2091(+)